MFTEDQEAALEAKGEAERKELEMVRQQHLVKLQELELQKMTSLPALKAGQIWRTNAGPVKILAVLGNTFEWCYVSTLGATWKHDIKIVAQNNWQLISKLEVPAPFELKPGMILRDINGFRLEVRKTAMHGSSFMVRDLDAKGTAISGWLPLYDEFVETYVGPTKRWQVEETEVRRSNYFSDEKPKLQSDQQPQFQLGDRFASRKRGPEHFSEVIGVSLVRDTFWDSKNRILGHYYKLARTWNDKPHMMDGSKLEKLQLVSGPTLALKKAILFDEPSCNCHNQITGSPHAGYCRTKGTGK